MVRRAPLPLREEEGSVPILHHLDRARRHHRRRDGADRGPRRDERNAGGPPGEDPGIEPTCHDSRTRTGPEDERMEGRGRFRPQRTRGSGGSSLRAHERRGCSRRGLRAAGGPLRRVAGCASRGCGHRHGRADPTGHPLARRDEVGASTSRPRRAPRRPDGGLPRRQPSRVLARELRIGPDGRLPARGAPVRGHRHLRDRDVRLRSQQHVRPHGVGAGHSRNSGRGSDLGAGRSDRRSMARGPTSAPICSGAWEAPTSSRVGRPRTSPSSRPFSSRSSRWA